jgi:hypothetical protein
MKPTDIYSLYEAQKNKKKTIKNFIKELEKDFLEANSHNPNIPVPKKVDGCKFLHTIRYSQLTDWNIDKMFRHFKMTQEQDLLCKRIDYMENCGHGGIVNIIEMLKRIVNKGKRGCFRGAGQLEYDLLCEDEDEGENHDEFLKRTFVGHFRHFDKPVTLTETDIKCIKNVLIKNNLL